MSLSSDSYGSVALVASLTIRYTNEGSFDANSNPSLLTVESWLDMLSGTLNVALAGAGFEIPITQPTAKKALDQLVIAGAADLAMAANTAGRFFSERAQATGLSPLITLQKELTDWVDRNAAGLEQLGATRNYSLAAGIATKSGDSKVFPIFQREGFHNSFTNWSDNEDD